MSESAATMLAADSPSSADEVASGRAPIRILLIDDELPIHAALCAVLRGSGAQITCALDMHDAGNYLIGAQMPDVILLDLNLGRTRAEETVKRIPLLTKRAPVVVLTGFNTDALMDSALYYGALNFLPKELFLDPCNAAMLLHAMLIAKKMWHAMGLHGYARG